MSEKKKILVIRFSSLGDVILTTCLFPNLKAHWPDSEITVLTKAPFSVVFDNNPHVDHVQVFDPTRQPFSQLTKEIRQEGFDLIIDLQNNFRSWFIRVISSARQTLSVEKAIWARRKLVWFKKSSEILDQSVRERILECLNSLEVPIKHEETILYPKAVERVLDTFSLDSKAKLIGIAPGAKHQTKQWTVEGFAEAANRLGAMPGTQIVLLGDVTDKAVAKKIFRLIKVPCKDLVGWTNIRELIAVVSRLELLVTNDSGILHIGEALGTKLVSIFGPTVRAFGFTPYRKTSRVVEVNNLPCRPCTLHGDEQCPLKHHRCMTDIDVNAVLLATSMLMDGPEPAEPVSPHPSS